MAFDDLSKQIFKHKFGDAIRTDIKVGALEKSFDLHLNGLHPLVQTSDLIPAPFKHVENNIIEYKSGHDAYHTVEILKLLGDFAYYSYNRRLPIKDAFAQSCLWFIVVHAEPFAQEYRQMGLEKDPQDPGFYFYPAALPPMRVVVINELDPALRENAFLLILSSGNTFQAFSKTLNRDTLLREELKKYISVKLFIDSKEVADTEEVKTLKRNLHYSLEENIRASVEELGLKKVIDAVGVEEVVKAVGVEEVVKAVGVEEVIKTIGLKTLLKHIPKAELRKYLDH